MHRNCWLVGGKRFNCFKDAMYAPGDLLPMLVGKVLYPLELIRSKGLGGYHHVDANIGKIIVPGRSAGRNFELFEKAAAAGGGGPAPTSLAAKALAWHMALTPSLEDEEATPPRALADFDSVASPRRGAQSGDTETSKTRTRRRIMTSPFKERGPRGVARARTRTTMTSRRQQRIDVAMIIIKK